MKLLITFLSLGIFLISCSDKKKKLEDSFLKVDDWEVLIEKGITDTISLESWLPKPELHLQFIKKSDSTCLVPYLDFYPIELKEYIESKLTRYLIFRASLYPPPPNIYRTNEYYILGWNLTDYNDQKCCNYTKLEEKLIKKLNLQITTKLE